MLFATACRAAVCMHDTLNALIHTPSHVQHTNTLHAMCSTQTHCMPCVAHTQIHCMPCVAHTQIHCMPCVARTHIQIHCMPCVARTHIHIHCMPCVAHTQIHCMPRAQAIFCTCMSNCSRPIRSAVCFAAVCPALAESSSKVLHVMMCELEAIELCDKHKVAKLTRSSSGTYFTPYLNGTWQW
jgi:hypothetical protein